jgi:hypothetical protein
MATSDCTEINMAECRECKEPISNYAGRCPYCGDRAPLGNEPDRMLKTFLGSAGGIVVLYLAWRLFGRALVSILGL